ncbi:FIST signal transduction protein [Algirhabdus cladophorae]|uniref:FIST signal transduction protein n=1 Tax=Algirhabdus cladophorae TaxID=3377108 RepID=UPI003B849CC6
MLIETHATAGTDRATIQNLLAPLEGRSPDFLVFHCSSAFDLADLNTQLAPIAANALHGATSCLGAMTNAGMAGTQGNGIGYFALWDADGSFGTAGAKIVGDAAIAASTATRTALARADRLGEAPDLIWVSASPGQEEAIICGIQDVVGADIPIVGGSAADNTVAGQWAIFGSDGIIGDGVQISVLFPSAPLAAEFQSGYAPSGQFAHATRANGRRLYELDGRPAVEVYQDLTGLSFQLPTGPDPVSILSHSSFHPLGRKLGDVANIPYYMLMHAAFLHADGSIEFFAEITEGAQLHFMRGSPQSLVARAGRVAAQSRKQLDAAPAGALVIYCAGCMLSITDRMDEVAAGIDQSLDGAPFLGVFTFGEQGYALNQENSHGNLMISCVTFSA